ncbi:hypothetical protein OG426_30570 [Streptomyces canus]|uniref:hypothetical protein n=1 Tax=Streptomyces canus TaxID=58343 RepID=UPI0022524AD8|nr:hypothetical protein [Streptomyces canus]MCX4858303.1 hypothetical protein [Streptomyces canus]WSW36479.1 hypothetical protein OG426_30570 [Streptomyces canus]
MTGGWALRAPCCGLDGFTVGENDWKTGADLKRLCGPQLATCGPCPFRAECIATVKPAQAFFDGIAGGRLWCNGVVIASLDDVCDEELAEAKLRASCGTEAGAKDHIRHGESPCPSCRQAAREMTARRKEAKAKAKPPEQLQLDFATT